MEKENLIRLLHEIQIPDTEKVKAVTADLQKNYYSNPESLLLLIEISLTHSDEAIRKLASVQALRLVPKHWQKGLTPDQRNAARSHLFEGTIRESSESIRNSNARIISGIAHLDLDDKTEGQDLLQSILALNNSPDVRSRELGSYIVYELIETDPTNFADDLSNIFKLLQRNIHDADSKNVRVNSVKTIWSLLMLIETDDTPTVKAVQDLIPPTVNMLKESISAEDDTAYNAIFETLSLFLSYDSVFLAPHLGELLHFMMEIAVNHQVASDARIHAIDFLSQCARFRRMKLQAMKEACAYLSAKTIGIVAELNPDDDDNDDDSPARAALILIDQLAGNLPPRQVIVPLLDEFAKYATSPEPAFRRAAILSLGVACEGAPEFIATQVDTLLPKILALLHDSDETVRNAALQGLTNMADQIADPLAKHHEQLVGALLENLEAASHDVSNKRSVNIIRAACTALDSLGDGIDNKEMSKYGPRLIIPMGKLLAHDDFGVKAAAAGAIGAIAESLGKDFGQYFQDVMSALEPFVTLKEEAEALALRSATVDTMGRIAIAVGSDMFEPYVIPLMRASEDAMTLDSDRLKETSFLLWSALSKVYGEKFAPFLEGVFKGLFDALELEEKVLTLPPELGDTGSGVMVVGGKKLIFKERDGSEDMQENEEDEDGDLDPITGTSLEQECALDVLGDVIANSCGADALHQYVQPALSKLEPLCEHSYEGVRKNAITTYWRIYARMWNVWEEQTGQKWKPGLPADPKPDNILVELGSIVEKVTMAAWVDDPECAVIYDINIVVANTLKACGPAILGVKDTTLEDVIKNVEKVLSRTHACQQDMGDEDDEQNVEGDSSEMDWMVLDSALEVITGLSAALGGSFLTIWKRFEQPILKFVSSSVELERSTAVGVIAEIIKYSGDAITPYTQPLQTLLKRRITDPDTMTKSNAIYGMGQLILNSSSTDATIPTYGELWEILEPLLDKDEPHLVDNIYGCLARMMMRNPDQVFVDQVLPKLVSHLPIKGDYEENEPVYKTILRLYEQGNPTVQQLTSNLIPVFEQVLSPPEEQVDDDTRNVIKQTVAVLAKAQPDLFSNSPNVLHLAGVA
jgi:hypothetical protein